MLTDLLALQSGAESAEHGGVLTTVIGIVGLLLVAVLSVIGFKRARVPYTVGLVLVGLVLGAVVERFEVLAPLAEIELSPDVILFVFLPTLIFESAFNLNSRLLYQNLVPVLTLAAPGLLLSTGAIGGLIALLTPLPLGSALLFGALISATDPVAVVALFRELGTPKRLTILVEGESLFNDATAIVLFHIILAVAVGGAVGTATVGSGALEFLRVFLGGLGVGALVGYLLVKSVVMAEDDPLIEVALSTVVAYAAFLAAEHALHVSGVMATVGAGVVVSTFGTPRFTVPVRAFLHQFWEYAAFIANGLIFLLVGLSIRLDGLVEYAGPIAWAILAALVVRGIVVFGIVPLVGRLPKAEPIDMRYRTVLWWGGLRGAVGLALAYSLAVDFPQRDLIIAMSVGVVLFTLVTGGFTMGKLIHALGLDKPSLVERIARAQASAAAEEEATMRLQDLASSGHYSVQLIAELRREYADRSAQTARALEQLKDECQWMELRGAIWAEALTAEKTAYRDLLDAGVVSEPVLRELDLAIDLERDDLNAGREPSGGRDAAPMEVRLTEAGFRLLERVIPRSRFVQRHQLRAVAMKYERDSAVVEASRRVTKEIERLSQLSGTSGDIVDEVTAIYQQRERDALGRIDAVAEHFPEFTAAVQRLAARRIGLDGELDAIERLASAGSIPPSVAEAAQSKLMAEQRRLARQPVEILAPDPAELLERVPIFRHVPRDAFAEVTGKLVPRTVLAGECILRQGERGTSLFLIARGVVAILVARDGDEPRRVASLHVGDFFGEMALLTEAPRTATVQAVSDCHLFELSKRDVDALCLDSRGLRASLETAYEERKTKL